MQLGSFHRTTHVKKPALSPLSCTIKQQQFFQDSASNSFPQHSIFHVGQAEGGTTNVDTLFGFDDIPSGSFGCQVAMSSTLDYPINSSGTQLNVYALQSEFPSEDAHGIYFPGGGRGTLEGSFLWATTTITGQKAVLNSQGCRPTSRCLFEIASSTAAGDNFRGLASFT